MTDIELLEVRLHTDFHNKFYLLSHEKVNELIAYADNLSLEEHKGD